MKFEVNRNDCWLSEEGSYTQGWSKSWLGFHTSIVLEIPPCAGDWHEGGRGNVKLSGREREKKKEKEINLNGD